MDFRHPPAEREVDRALARRLLEAQHPHHLTGDLTFVGEGWDNFIFRVGAEYALRLPRREVAVELLRNEQRWLPTIAERLTLSVPVPVAVGEPSALFPWPWSVVPWIEGTTAEDAALSQADAALLGWTLRSLHQAAPPEAPANPFRGVPLEERRPVIEERVDRLGVGRLRPLWEAALDAPGSTGDVWLHGDLHPRNVLVDAGGLVGLIDWGDMNGGDPATDLACAWTLFGSEARATLREVYRPTEPEWRRARGWAVHLGSAMADSGDPSHVALGWRILAELETELQASEFGVQG
ncbi:MAG: aminoglycoside phosphotransferase family protein [Gemmatimonadota bacterium]|nr:aminoglycoside phosphotransferase family protein [Gemmatimonadota bacterium]